MGWLFCEPTRRHLVDRILGDRFTGEQVRRLDHSLQGNKLWVLYAYTHDPDKRFIVLYKLAGTRGDLHPDYCRWGYKDVDESMGPCEYGCPERLLAQSTDQHDYAVSWREDCRAWNKREAARKKHVRALKRGDKFEYGGGRKPITFVSASTRPAFVVGYGEDGVSKLYWKSRINLPEAPAHGT